MLLALYLSTSLAADTAGAPARGEDLTSVPPAVVVHRQPAVPLVSLRLSIVADDPPGYAGTGHLVQHLVEDDLRERVQRVGGRVRLERTSDAVVFSVTGPAVELSELAASLRSVLAPVRASDGELLRASRELAEERLADWEMARLHVRSALRAGVFPSDLPAAGTPSSAARLVRRSDLEAAWAALYRPDRVSLTAVGDVRLEQVEAAFGEAPPAWTATPLPEGRDTATLAPLAPAQATRGWVAIAHPGSDESPATVSIATRIAGDLLRARLPGADDVDAEHWWSHHGQALVLVAAVQGDDLPAARRQIGTILGAARERLTPGLVSEAARAIRRDMLFYSRTPDRMAEVLGSFADREGDPDAAQTFYAELQEVEVEDVRRALDRMLDRSAIRAEVPPQALIQS